MKKKLFKVSQLIFYIISFCFFCDEIIDTLSSKENQFIKFFFICCILLGFLLAIIAWFFTNIRWCKFCHRIRWVHLEKIDKGSIIRCNTCKQEIDFIENGQDYDEDAMP